MQKLTVQEKKYFSKLDEAIAEYEAPKAQSADVDPVELYDVRHEIRPEYEKAVREKYAEILGMDLTSNAVFNARYNTDKLLREKEDERAVRKIIKEKNQKKNNLRIYSKLNSKQSTGRMR